MSRAGKLKLEITVEAPDGRAVSWEPMNERSAVRQAKIEAERGAIVEVKRGPTVIWTNRDGPMRRCPQFSSRDQHTEEIADMDKCHNCSGKGDVAGHPCDICDGTGVEKEMPPGPCLECDGSGWLDDDQTEMCCECDGTGTEHD